MCLYASVNKNYDKKRRKCAAFKLKFYGFIGDIINNLVFLNVIPAKSVANDLNFKFLDLVTFNGQNHIKSCETTN